MKDWNQLSICRFSGESWDRQIASDEGTSFIPDTEKHFVELRNRIFEDGDFYLTKGEKALIEKVAGSFDKVALWIVHGSKKMSA